MSKSSAEVAADGPHKTGTGGMGGERANVEINIMKLN